MTESWRDPMPHANYDTFPKLLVRNYEKWPDNIAMRKKDFGIWNEHTWRDSYENVKYSTFADER